MQPLQKSARKNTIDFSIHRAAQASLNVGNKCPSKVHSLDTPRIRNLGQEESEEENAPIPEPLLIVWAIKECRCLRNVEIFFPESSCIFEEFHDSVALSLRNHVCVTRGSLTAFMFFIAVNAP